MKKISIKDPDKLIYRINTDEYGTYITFKESTVWDISKCCVCGEDGLRYPNITSLNGYYWFTCSQQSCYDKFKINPLAYIDEL